MLHRNLTHTVCLFYFQEEQANLRDWVKSDTKYDTDQLGGVLMGRVCGKSRAYAECSN